MKRWTKKQESEFTKEWDDWVYDLTETLKEYKGNLLLTMREAYGKSEVVLTPVEMATTGFLRELKIYQEHHESLEGAVNEVNNIIEQAGYNEEDDDE